MKLVGTCIGKLATCFSETGSTQRLVGCIYILIIAKLNNYIHEVVERTENRVVKICRDQHDQHIELPVFLN
ncbi:MAG: hypothetical protein CMH66_06310 [Nioella sp.]|nr:hypothetical protein [Nioella sp.]